MNNQATEQEIIKLSEDKWRWMAEKDVHPLKELFDEKAEFIHMGGTFGKEEEIQMIASGMIHYKHVDVHSIKVNVIGRTAILIGNITLLAVVAGNEVTTKFYTTEVYTSDDGSWKMAALAFTKIFVPGGVS